MAEPCVPVSARPPRRCTSHRVMSTRRRRPRRLASRARNPASSIRATPTLPSTCSKNACAPWKAPRTRAPPLRAWPRSARHCSAASRQATISWRHARCSAPAAGWSRRWRHVTASRRRWSTAPTLPIGKRRLGRTPSCSSWKARPTRHWRWSTSPPSPRLPIRSARAWSWTMSSPRRCSRSRCNSAPMLSSIRRPSISTDRVAASAASSCRTRNGSTRTCTTISATPARAFRRSMPGRC